MREIMTYARFFSVQVNCELLRPDCAALINIFEVAVDNRLHKRVSKAQSIVKLITRELDRPKSLDARRLA